MQFGLFDVLFTEIEDFALSRQKHLREVQNKGLKDLVTEVDIYIDEKVKSFIKSNFPDDSLLTEEGGFTQGISNRCWVLDPLDGTINYARGLPLWGVSLALLENNIPISCWISLPALEERYCGQKGEGSFCNGNKLRVSTTSNINMALLSNGDFNVGAADANKINALSMEKQANAAMRVKCMGSAVLEGCFVASGRLDAYILEYCHPWDVAGTALLVQEAGGKVSNIGSLDFKIEDECTLLQSNGHLHQEIQRVIRPEKEL
jgi:fructose-1,6-bisphosphatase/inositol monophosphatase family enzyme